MKRLLLFAMAIVFAMHLSAQETTYAVGEYSTGTSSYVPLYTFYNYSYSQSIYPADSLQPGMITAISYKYAASDSETIPSVIYMGEVTRSAFSGITDWIPVSELTQVFSGSVTFSNGWVRIDLNEHFNYTGEGNLVVAYVNERGYYTSSRYFNTFSINSASLYEYRDESIISPSNPPSGSVVSYVPSTKFHVWPEGVEYCYPPENLTVSNITSTSADITWTANEESTSSEYGIAYRAEGSEEWIELDNVSGENTSVADLEAFTRYEVKVWAICSEVNSPETIVSFVTSPDESVSNVVPFYEDFDSEDYSKWNMENGTAVNQWHRGTAENNTMTEEGTPTEGGGAMYISNDNGATNAYNNGSTSTVYLYTFVNFGEGDAFKLTFDRKVMGESSYDYLRVYLMDVDADFPTSSVPSESLAITPQLNEQNSWIREYILISGENANTTKKLVFMWRNDGYGGDNPPAAIDNVSVTSTFCDFATNVSVETVDMGESVSADVYITDNNDNATEYIVEYKLASDNAWTSMSSSDNPVVVNDLLHSSRYDLRVFTVCDGEDTSFVSNVFSFNTPCVPVIEFPYVMNFEETFQEADGVIGNRAIPLCWYNINGGYNSYYWTNGSYGAYNGSQCLQYNGAYSGGNYAFSDWVISPAFELTGGERMNFMAKVTSSAPATLKVYAKDVSEEDISSIADTSDFTLVETLHLNASGNYESYEVGLGAYTSNTRIALVVNSISPTFYIDSLTISALPECPEVYGLRALISSSESISVDFNATTDIGSGYVLAYGQAASAEEFDPNSAETIPIGSADELPYIIDGLTTGETYYFAVKQSCADEFSDVVSCQLQSTVTLPYEQNFEDLENVSEWSFVSSEPNEWFIGSVVNNTEDGMNSLYVTNDDGVTNAYTPPATYSTNYIYASTIVEFGEGIGFLLSYDWKASGNYDNYLKVFLMPTDAEIPNNSEPYFYEISNGEKYGASSWQRDTIILDGSCANTTQKVVFMWSSYGEWDGSVYNPPAAIDNINIDARECVEVTNLTLTTEDAGESANITVSFTDANEVGNYTLEYKLSDATEWTVITNLNETTYTIEDLLYGTEYDVRVMTVCSDEAYSNYVEASIYTACSNLIAPWSETFDSDVSDSPCWGIYSGAFPTGTMQISSLTPYSYGWSHSTLPVNGIENSRMETNIYYTNQYWLVTPSIDLGDGSTTYQIAADVMLRKYGSDADPEYASDDMFAILVSTDNGQSWSSANALVYKDGDADTEHDFSDLGRTPTRVMYKLVDTEGNPITGVVKFAFFGGSTVSNTDSRLFIDNVDVSEWSECPAPYAVTVSNIGTETATVSFSEAGSATSWEYVLLEDGETDPEGGTPVEISTNPIALTGLSAGTAYAVAVRSVCDDYSPWSSVARFSTVTELPYSTDFSNEADNAVWSTTTSGANSWAFGSATAMDDGGMSAYVSNDGGTSYVATSDASIMYMKRLFDFGDGSVTYNLEFEYKISGHIEGSTVSSGIVVYVLEPTVSLPATSLPSQDPVAILQGQEDWTNTMIELTGLSGTKQIVFLTWGYDQTGALTVPAAIDDLSIDEATCLSPTEIDVTNITETTADISWTGTSDSYVISYGPANGTDEDLVEIDATESPFTLTDLTPSTEYIFAIKGICGEDESAYNGYYLFRTACGAIPAPWTENFNSDVSDDECWSQGKALLPQTGTVETSSFATSSSWSYSTSIVNGVSDSRMKINIWSNTYKDWLITPSIDLGDGSTVYQIAVDVMLTDYYNDAEPDPAPDDRFAILVSTDNGATWSADNALIYADNDDDTEHNFSDLGRTPTRATYVLTDVDGNPISGVVKFAFYGESTQSNGDNDLYIDNIEVSEAEEVVVPDPCAEPTDLTVANITETTAELTWTAGGSESSWQVRLGEDGDAVDVTATSHTFTELTASTQYTAYVRANCGESYSTWVSIAFTTAGEGIVNPVVTTVAASNVTETEATLNATVVEGSEAITARGFRYKTTDATDWNDVAATGTTTLTATLTDLTPATSYEFKAYVTVGTEEFEGEVLTFTTESEEIEIVMGTVETNEASNINDHTAVLNGTLTSNGGDDSYTVGFLMSTMEDFDMETPNVVNLPATETAGALTANATELESGTNYFFRAYITNDAGTAYGEVKTFVTTSGLSDAEGGLRAVIYPNPASGKATVEIEGLNESARLIVTDLQGRVLSSDDLQSGASRYEMDLTGFASGVYYIRIVTDNSVSTQKLIVK